MTLPNYRFGPIDKLYPPPVIPRERRFKARHHDAKIDDILDEFGCATIWQLSDACGMKGNTIYPIIRRMEAEGRAYTERLDPARGSTSPSVVVRAKDPRGWDEYRLQLVDIRIQACETGTWTWHYTFAGPPRIGKGGVVLPVLSAGVSDDVRGDAALARIKASGCAEAVYSDPDRDRARVVWTRSREELGVPVSILHGYQERTHPRSC